MNTIIMSDPYLIKKIYSSPHTTDNSNDLMEDPDLFLTTSNGESWSKRRKIIFGISIFYCKFCTPYLH